MEKSVSTLFLFYAMQHFTTHLHDEAATHALGAALARAIRPGMILYLHGELGTGKTALTRALLHAAGHQGHVKSPTYTLVEPYAICVDGTMVELMHFDLYRMIGADEFIDAGFRDYFGSSTICIVEWPEKADGVLPTADLDIFLTVVGQGREVKFTAHSDQGFQCLARLNFAPNL